MAFYPAFAGAVGFAGMLGARTPFETSGNINEADEIYEIRVRNVWIWHGFWSGLASIVTGPLGGSSVTHWWVEIET